MVDYKLRLGDGTTFSVDEKGLTTWLQGGLVDDKARVQPAGSKKWFTLKQVLAAQGTQRGHAVRQTEQGRADVDRQAAEETAEIERKVAEQRAAEERKAAEEQRKHAEELAAAERKAAADRNAAERKLIKDREDAERRAAEERAEAEAAAKARAEAERQAEQERLETERRAAEERAEAERRAAEERAEVERRAAEERAEAERVEAEAREAARVAEAEKRVAGERAERAEKKRKAEEARLEAEKRAAEDARLAAERKAAEERAAELKRAEERAAAERREAEAREAEAREAARVAEAERQIANERAERAEKKRIAEEERAAEKRAEQARLAEERAAEQRAAEERLAAERRAADERLAARAAAERAARERERAAEMEGLSASALSEPPETEIAIEPAASMVKVEDFERELALVPVMFNDGTDPAGRGADARTSRPAQAPSRSESAGSIRGDGAPSTFVKPPTAVDNAVLRLLKVLDRGVVWVVKTLAPMVGDAAGRSLRALTSAGPKLKGMLARRAAPVEATSPDDVPSVPVAEAPAPWAAPAPPVPPAPRKAPAPVSAPAPAVAPPPWAAPPPPPLAASAPLKLKTTGPAPQREAAVPPPSFQKMEVIPFAAAPAEAKGDEDVWEGDDPWEEPGPLSSMFSVAWRWVKRLTIATALIVTVAVLALNKEKWLPQAEDAANVLGQNVDKLQESTRTVPPEAIAAAYGEIPYLRPATIEIIMAKSTGVLAPEEVFRRAHQAVEVARPSLPTHVAAEIDNLTTAAAAQLDGGEGEQLRGYLAALRAGTPTAAYQDKEAVWLMTRGVRRLSAEQLARMQELFAQAVTVALKPPTKS